MANRNPRKFESIASQEAASASMIPITSNASTGAVFTRNLQDAQWDMAALQAQMINSTNRRSGTTWTVNNTTWFDAFSNISTNRGDFPVHEKMKGQARPYAADLEVHWKRAKKLGLTAQAEAIEKMALKQDIQELTKGAGYPEVTDRDLEAMFEFPRLQKKVRNHNWKAAWINAWRIITMGDDQMNKIVLRLKKDQVERSGVAIPFGAQLRLEEAKEKAIFTSFQVVYPNVVTEAQLAAERARERDPALVGIYEGSMFLICSWDLPKDIQKAEADMDALKALKIEG